MFGRYLSAYVVAASAWLALLLLIASPLILLFPGYALGWITARAEWIDPARCQGCGACTADCPAKAIQLLGYRDEQIMSGVGAWEVREAVGIST